MGQRLDLNENQKIFIGQELELITNVEFLITQAKQDINAQLGKLPPQATELEESVLGALIIESTSHATMDILEPEHFHKETHADIFRMLKKMKFEGKRIDIQTVVVCMRQAGLIEKIGGAYAIAEITAKVSSAANIDYHAHVLIEMSIKREILRICSDVQREGYTDIDFADLIDMVEKRMAIIKSWIR